MLNSVLKFNDNIVIKFFYKVTDSSVSYLIKFIKLLTPLSVNTYTSSKFKSLEREIEMIRKRQRRKDDRPEEIIQAAIEVFLEHRYAGTTFSQVASKIDMSRSNIYLYFKNKDELFRACVMAIAKEKRLFVKEQVFDANIAIDEKITLICDTFCNIFSDDKFVDFTVLILSEAKHFPEVAASWREVVFKMAWDLWHECLAQEKLHALQMKLLITQIIAPFLMTALSKHAFGADDMHCSLEELRQELPKLILANLKLLKQDQ